MIKAVVKFACLVFILFTRILTVAELINIALNKATEQNGTLHYPDREPNAIWWSYHAVDGNKTCDTSATWEHYSGTAVLDTPWWQIDLGSVYSIKKIVIYGQPQEKPYQLKGFRLFITRERGATIGDMVYNNTVEYGNGVFTIQPASIYQCGQFVMIDLPKTNFRQYNGPLVLCEVEIYISADPSTVCEDRKDISDIARFADIHESPTSIYLNYDYKAANVLNNNPLLPNIDTCSCCWVSESEDNPYIQLILPTKTPLSLLKVIGYPDYPDARNLQHIMVFIDGQTVRTSDINYNPLENSALIPLSLAVASNITISRPRPNPYPGSEWYLIICEIHIYREDCADGRYGISCEKECTNCLHGKCDVKTGRCLHGCTAGYISDYCNQTCPSNKYEANCSQDCGHCKDNTTCNHVDGSCKSGCAPGYKPEDPTCKSICAPLSYGADCSKKCGHCQGDNPCNHVDGSCLNGCAPGYKIDPNCIPECDRKTYGQNCSQYCGNCYGDTSCNHVNGSCMSGCAPGYHPDDPLCKSACYPKTYGINCSQDCGHCKDNNTSCNHVNGSCMSGCEAGYKTEDPTCKSVCERGTFGIDCTSKCHCINHTLCNNVNGTCYEAKCDPGWLEHNCTVPCGDGSFGTDCLSKCHCTKKTPCNNEDGTCKEGLCDAGWIGQNCSIEYESLKADQDNSNTAALVGGTSAAIIVVTIVVLVGFFMYRRHKANSTNQNSGKTFSNLDEALAQKQQIREESHSSQRISGNNNTAFIETNDDDKTDTKRGTEAADAGGGYYDFSEIVGIKIHELWDYIHEKTKNECELLYGEFKKLPSGLIHQCASADHIANRGKNRYREMYAYDHNRVILEEKNDKGTDYVNANYIDGYNLTRKFVACQGPTKQMIDDFWRMVWQLKSDKIVMLTNLVEMGATKCVLYWPKDVEFSYGKVNVKIVKVDTDLDFDIRHLDVWKAGESSRRIRQYHFKSWPDKDVPDSTWCLLKFWRAVETDAKSSAGPIVVHCSAGVGRTGTFIALDNLIHQARDEGCVRPFQIVQTLRGQRVNMVQTKEQYVYLHEVLADALCYGTHFVWSTQFESMYMSLLQKEDGGTKTRLEVQYDLIQKSLKNTDSKDAEAPEYSNMETMLSESDAYRPKLKKRGSKFIQQLGATFIPNYDGRNTFLVALSPDKSTIEEFWSLVDDLNIKTVIMLTEKSSTCYKTSCDLGAQNDNGTKFDVNKIKEKIGKGHIERSFTFKGSQGEEGDQLVTIKQFEYTAWKDGYVVPGDPHSLIDFLEAVLKWQPHVSKSQPVLLCDSDGCTRSGILCVALNEVQRIKTEGGHINIVQSVKTMKQRKPQLISNFEQYKFCYEIVLAYLKHTEVYQNLK